MAPGIATVVFAIIIGGLYFLDQEKKTAGTSPALWIAVTWVFIGASRMVSQWVRLEAPDAAEVYVEGSPLDRNILTILIILSVLVLFARGRRTAAVLKANAPILLFFGYCAASVLWSDFPFVALKRWTKAAGNLTMVLLVLTDPQPAAAVKRLFAWTGFLLIPLSVLLIKYYPNMGRGYFSWSWETFFVGVATDKNGLGALCMLFGLAAFWRFVHLYRERAGSDGVGPLVAQGALLVMVCWLFMKAESVTSAVCFTLGALLILLTIREKNRQPARLHAMMATLVCLGLLGYALPELYGLVLDALGRDRSLTGRTDIWADVFNVEFNPLVGTGFESFWLGSRLDYLWAKYSFHPNQAHNGYIETYLNLGWIGVGLLAILLVSGYRNVIKTFRHGAALGSLGLPFFLVAVSYNFTEAAFKVMNPVWIAFLLAIASTPLPLLAGDGTATRADPHVRRLTARPRATTVSHRGRAFR